MTKPTTEQSVEVIKNAVTQYEDGFITAYEMFNRINDMIKVVKWEDLEDEHLKALNESE